MHPCVDILIGISHETHYRLLIYVCPVTPSIAAWSPCWIFISPTAEPADSCTCVIWSHFEWWQISLPKDGFGKSYTGIPVTSALSLYEPGKQCWVQSLPPKCSVIGAGHGPSSNIYVAKITILNSITQRPLFILELAPDQQWIMFYIYKNGYMYFRSYIYIYILPQDLTSNWSVVAPNWALRPSQDLVSDVAVFYWCFFFSYVLSCMSRLVNLKKKSNYTGLGDLSNLFGGVTSVSALSWPELCRMTGSSTF